MLTIVLYSILKFEASRKADLKTDCFKIYNRIFLYGREFTHKYIKNNNLGIM